jgi:hypothetical protein
LVCGFGTEYNCPPFSQGLKERAQAIAPVALAETRRRAAQDARKSAYSKKFGELFGGGCGFVSRFRCSSCSFFSSGVCGLACGRSLGGHFAESRVDRVHAGKCHYSGPTTSRRGGCGCYLMLQRQTKDWQNQDA